VYYTNVYTIECVESTICFFNFQEGDEEIASRMQELALAEGALPKHLHTALYTVNTNDNRLLTNR